MPDLLELDPESQWVPDLDTAVSQALARLKLQQNAEQAGAIFQNTAGLYGYSLPITMRDRDNFAFDVKSGGDQKLAAFWHTHPADMRGDDSGFFSPNDLSVANQLNIPSYIKFLADGSLRRYTPKKTHTLTRRVAGSMTPIRVSRGDEVILIPPQLFAQEPAP